MERTETEKVGAGFGGVHIHARLVAAGHSLAHHVDITVFGPDDAFRGSGWVTTLPGAEGESFGGDGTFRCFYTQQGLRRSNLVRLSGVTLHSPNPRDVGASVTTEIDISSGIVGFVAESLNGVRVRLEGVGTVTAAPGDGPIQPTGTSDAHTDIPARLDGAHP
jgi:hypothetical protein